MQLSKFSNRHHLKQHSSESCIDSRQCVLLEISQRERESVVDADNRRRSFGEPLNQPLGNAPPSPILPRARRWLDFLRGSQTVGFANAQSLWARLGRLCARIVDADVAFECGVHHSGLTAAGSFGGEGRRSAGPSAAESGFYVRSVTTPPRATGAAPIALPEQDRSRPCTHH